MKEAIWKTLIVHFHFASLFSLYGFNVVCQFIQTMIKKSLIIFFKRLRSMFTIDGLEKECDND